MLRTSFRGQSRGRCNLLSKAIKIAAGVAAGVSLLTLVGPIVGEAIATMPPPFFREAVNPLTEWAFPYEDVSFPTTDGLTLRGWFVPAEGRDAPAIVYAPATGHDQRSGLSLVPAFHEAGYHVLLFSYRGHALSDGRRGEFTYGDAESRDVDAAVQFLHQVKGIRRIGAIGHSAGAVSTILSAARNPLLGAVVAVAPYNCVTEVWRTGSPAAIPSFILDWTLWVAEKLRGFDREEVCPVEVVDRIAPRSLLVIHGTDDQRITETQARRMFEAAGEPKALWMVEGASHGGIRAPVLDALALDVVGFFDRALQDKPQPGSSLARIPSGQVFAQ
jgi:dipeptidyl aminopeptidase/acylaminoacyl peptidase